MQQIVYSFDELSSKNQLIAIAHFLTSHDILLKKRLITEKCANISDFENLENCLNWLEKTPEYFKSEFIYRIIYRILKADLQFFEDGSIFLV